MEAEAGREQCRKRSSVNKEYCRRRSGLRLLAMQRDVRARFSWNQQQAGLRWRRTRDPGKCRGGQSGKNRDRGQGQQTLHGLAGYRVVT